MVRRALQNPAQSLQGSVRSIPMGSVPVWRWEIQAGRALSQPGPPRRLTKHITRAGGSVTAWAALIPHPSSNRQWQESGIHARCKVPLFSTALCKSRGRGTGGRRGRQSRTAGLSLLPHAFHYPSKPPHLHHLGDHKLCLDEVSQGNMQWKMRAATEMHRQRYAKGQLREPC